MYQIGDKVEVKVFGKWRTNGVIVSVTLGTGNNNTEYIVECDQDTDQGVQRMMSGAKSEHMIRPMPAK